MNAQPNTESAQPSELTLQVAETLEPKHHELPTLPPLTWEQMRKHMFVLWHKKKFKPNQDVFFAENFKDAQRKGEKYCESWGLRFISVQPFAIDINNLRDPNVPVEEIPPHSR